MSFSQGHITECVSHGLAVRDATHGSEEFRACGTGGDRAIQWRGERVGLVVLTVGEFLYHLVHPPPSKVEEWHAGREAV